VDAHTLVRGSVLFDWVRRVWLLSQSEGICNFVTQVD
jgi:hypothetical protein